MGATFVLSATTPDRLPAGEKPEVCLVGRSNVGKSSVINALANAKVAITSKTPGRTRTLNYYDFGRFAVVDLPGYGFARMGGEAQRQSAEMIAAYLNGRPQLRMVLLVCDAGVVMPADLEMAATLAGRYAQLTVVANKADRLSANERRTFAPKVAAYLGVPGEAVLPFSAREGFGVSELLKRVAKAV